MLIRCDKCTTLYELDEALLPPGGAPVQCSKCQYVFVAKPPRPAAPEQVNEATTPQAAARPGRPASEGRAAPEAPPAAGAAAEPRTAPIAPAIDPKAKFTPDGRPIRKVQFPTEEPQLGPKVAGLKSSDRPTVRVGPAGRRHPWLIAGVLAVVLLLVAGGVVTWLLLRHGRDAHRRPAHHAAQAPAQAVMPAPAAAPAAPAPAPAQPPAPAPTAAGAPAPTTAPGPAKAPARRPAAVRPPPPTSPDEEPAPPRPPRPASPEEEQVAPAEPTDGTTTP